MSSVSSLRLILGDSRQELPNLPSESVHLVLTDIPYGISQEEWDVLHQNKNSALGGQSPAQEKLGTAFRRRGKPINGWSKADQQRPIEYQTWCREWADPLWKLLKPGASVFLFCGRRTVHRAMIALEDAGFLVRDLLCWQKPTAHHRAQSLSKLFSRRGLMEDAARWEGWRLGNLAPYFEPIVWLFKPYRVGGTIADNVLLHGVGAMNVADCQIQRRHPGNILSFDFADDEPRVHPTQKPVALLQFLIRLTTLPGQTVLDPFLGSGSTGVAAISTGRLFLGIEQDPQHFQTAQRRIQAAALPQAEG